MSNSRPIPEPTAIMFLLAADMLDRAGDEFGSHGCNDYQLPDVLTAKDRLDLSKAMHTWNGDPEEARNSRYCADWFLMHFLAAVFRRAAGDAGLMSPERAAEAYNERTLEEVKASEDAIRKADEEIRSAEKRSREARRKHQDLLRRIGARS